MKKKNLIKYAGRAFMLLKNFKPHDLYKYVPNYDDLSLYQKLMAMGGLLSDTIILPIIKLYYVMRSRETPKRHKMYIMGALGYFILPMDLIPDFLPALIGFTDDIVVISLVLKLIQDNITPELEIRARRAYSLLLRRSMNLPPVAK